MNTKTQRLCAWSTPVFLALFLIGILILARFVPPPSPSLAADELARIFNENRNGIRLGCLVAMLGVGLLGPFVAVISVQLKRIEGESSPLAYAQLVLGAYLLIVIIGPLTNLEAAAFRADRAPELIQLVSDQAWLLFVGGFYPLVAQLTVIGVAILRDRSENPVFPRSLAYVNFWCAIGSAPAAGINFLKDGPLAWDGVMSWWIPVTAFTVWVSAMFVYLLKAIAAQDAMSRAGSGAG